MLRLEDVRKENAGACRRRVAPMVLKEAHFLIRTPVQVLSLCWVLLVRIVLHTPRVVEAKVRVYPAVTDVQDTWVRQDIKEHLVERYKLELMRRPRRRLTV